MGSWRFSIINNTRKIQFLFSTVLTKCNLIKKMFIIIYSIHRGTTNLKTCRPGSRPAFASINLPVITLIRDTTCIQEPRPLILDLCFAMESENIKILLKFKSPNNVTTQIIWALEATIILDLKLPCDILGSWTSIVTFLYNIQRYLRIQSKSLLTVVNQK